MTRETQTYKIACPKCARTGEMDVSENDYAFMRRPDRQVSVSDGFTVKSSQAMTATCNDCGVEAK